MIQASLDWLTEPKEDEEHPRRFYGVATGRVINPLDPMMLGRVQVQLPFVDDLDLQPWARVCTPKSGIAAGIYFMPQVGDEVLLAFEHGDINAPYVIGSLWNAMAPPPFPSPLPQMHTIRTQLGNQINVFDVAGTIQLMTNSGQVITLSPAGVTVVSPVSAQILVGDNLVTITPKGVDITAAKTLNITAGASISITAGGKLSLTAAGDLSLTAPLVRIN
jgi:Type VI secretion system/phage-baseplate injector OB domain